MPRPRRLADKNGQIYDVPEDATPEQLQELLGPGEFFEIPPDATEEELQSLFSQPVETADQQRQVMAQGTPQSGRFLRSPVEEFAGGVWERTNPLTVAKGIYQTVRHPIETGRGILATQERLGTEAKIALEAGDYGRAARKLMAGAMPLVGPSADAAIERMLQGEVAAGAGNLAGDVILAGAPAASARPLLRAASGTQAGQRLGRWAQRGAEQRLASVMVPEVGANKVRFGVQAAKIAPEVLQEPAARGAWSFQGLKNRVEGLYAKAEAELDRAHMDPTLAKQVFTTAQVVKALKQARERYISRTARAKGIPSPGKDVVSEPNVATVQVLNQIIDEVERVGGKKHGLIRFESLRQIREAWDKEAAAGKKYSPSTTADYTTKRGRADGAYLGTSVLREKLATFSPANAKANKSYHLWKTAKDVMDAVEEVERVRPSRRHGVEAAMGALPGVATGDLKTAIIGAVVTPAIDAALYSGVTVQPRLAGLLADLATAIRTGNTARVQSLSSRITDWSKKAAPISILQPRTPAVTLPLAAEERPPGQ